MQFSGGTRDIRAFLSPPVVAIFSPAPKALTFLKHGLTPSTLGGMVSSQESLGGDGA